jgi:hypothetical protein
MRFINLFVLTLFMLSSTTIQAIPTEKLALKCKEKANKTKCSARLKHRELREIKRYVKAIIKDSYKKKALVRKKKRLNKIIQRSKKELRKHPERDAMTVVVRRMGNKLKGLLLEKVTEYPELGEEVVIAFLNNLEKLSPEQKDSTLELVVFFNLPLTLEESLALKDQIVSSGNLDLLSEEDQEAVVASYCEDPVNETHELCSSEVEIAPSRVVDAQPSDRCEGSSANSPESLFYTSKPPTFYYSYGEEEHPVSRANPLLGSLSGSIYGNWYSLTQSTPLVVGGEVSFGSAPFAVRITLKSISSESSVSIYGQASTKYTYTIDVSADIVHEYFKGEEGVPAVLEYKDVKVVANICAPTSQQSPGGSPPPSPSSPPSPPAPPSGGGF